MTTKTKKGPRAMCEQHLGLTLEDAVQVLVIAEMETDDGDRSWVAHKAAHLLSEHCTSQMVTAFGMVYDVLHANETMAALREAMDAANVMSNAMHVLWTATDGLAERVNDGDDMGISELLETVDAEIDRIHRQLQEHMDALRECAVA